MYVPYIPRSYRGYRHGRDERRRRRRRRRRLGGRPAPATAVRTVVRTMVVVSVVVAARPKSSPRRSRPTGRRGRRHQRYTKIRAQPSRPQHRPFPPVVDFRPVEAGWFESKTFSRRPPIPRRICKHISIGRRKRVENTVSSLFRSQCSIPERYKIDCLKFATIKPSVNKYTAADEYTRSDRYSIFGYESYTRLYANLFKAISINPIAVFVEFEIEIEI